MNPPWWPRQVSVLKVESKIWGFFRTTMKSSPDRERSCLELTEGGGKEDQSGTLSGLSAGPGAEGGKAGRPINREADENGDNI